jgi:hypothetical protein
MIIPAEVYKQISSSGFKNFGTGVTGNVELAVWVGSVSSSLVTG